MFDCNCCKQSLSKSRRKWAPGCPLCCMCPGANCQHLGSTAVAACNGIPLELARGLHNILHYFFHYYILAIKWYAGNSVILPHIHYPFHNLPLPVIPTWTHGFTPSAVNGCFYCLFFCFLFFFCFLLKLENFNRWTKRISTISFHHPLTTGPLSLN